MALWHMAISLSLISWVLFIVLRITKSFLISMRLILVDRDLMEFIRVMLWIIRAIPRINAIENNITLTLLGHRIIPVISIIT